jgi:hypothetical protein
MTTSKLPWCRVAVAGGWDGIVDTNGAMVCRLALNELDNADLIVRRYHDDPPRMVPHPRQTIGKFIACLSGFHLTELDVDAVHS